MMRLMGRPLSKGDLQYTPWGNGTIAEDESTMKEVALKLPAGWKNGVRFQGSGATLQEAEGAASDAALRALGKFKKLQWGGISNKTNTKVFAKYLGRALTRGGCEVVELKANARNDEMAGLLYLLAYL